MGKPLNWALRPLRHSRRLAFSERIVLSRFAAYLGSMESKPPLTPAEQRRARVRARFERQFRAIEHQMPVLQRPLTTIRARGWWIIRLPIALLLIAGGLLSILPFLGLWMLPVGLLLLAVDLPLLRAPLSVAMIRARRRYAVWRHKRGRKAPRR
jgi:hypothetical protein